MWWFVKKMREDETSIVYSYGCQTKEVSGEIEYLKDTQDIRCTKLAKDDTNKAVGYLLPHVWGAIVDDGVPEEKQIAIA